MNRSELVTAANKYEMEIDMPNIQGIRVRSSKTGGYWKIVSTVEEIKEINK